ncbi:Uncharacterized protein TCM_019704 [Theobroma cacao]|uniref:Uncharacterized protein n=1 Tax=Theobroma cacao TaxID=3641 RepID=A0A061EJ63_THECC|nr:Uncharacterized protein TCM_019704 [Theobroma cacao]
MINLQKSSIIFNSNVPALKRCEASVNGEILDALKTVIRIHKSVGESGGVCFRNLGRDAMKVMFRSNAKWWKLEDGYFKVDADGAFMKKSLKCSLGSIDLVLATIVVLPIMVLLKEH